MANLNTKQLADSMLGSSELVYRVNLDLPQPLRAQKDLKGFGDPDFDQFGNADTNPQHTPSVEGMLISIDRSPTTPLSNFNIGHWVVIHVPNLPVPLPDKFVLLAAFSDPELSLLSAQAQAGTYASAVLLSFGIDSAGTTVQVNGTQARMNLPGTTAGMSFDYTDAFYKQVINPGSPHHFTIAMLVERTATEIRGVGSVYAGAERAAEKNFIVRNGYNINSPIQQFRFGLGSATGTLYRASVRLHEIEVWFPS